MSENYLQLFKKQSDYTYNPTFPSKIGMDRFLFKNVEEYILANRGLSLQFINMVRQGQLDIFHQENILSILDKINKKYYGHNMSKYDSEFCISFRQVMFSLGTHIDRRYKRMELPQCRKSEISENFKIYGEYHAVFSTLINIRHLANKNLYQYYGLAHAKEKPHIEPCGNASLFLIANNSESKKLLSKHAGNYDVCNITKYEHDNYWLFSFNDHHEHLHSWSWAGMRNYMYRNISIVLETLFSCKTHVSIDWAD